jgi:hypothetical protein
MILEWGRGMVKEKGPIGEAAWLDSRNRKRLGGRGDEEGL